MKLVVHLQLLLLTVAAAVGVSCAPSAWTELGGVGDLSEAFDQDVGQTRIVLLLSPT